MTYPEACDFLFQLPSYVRSGRDAYHPGLDRTRALLAEMGDPQYCWQSVLVAGTNGKGTTASLLAAMLTASGVRTGLHTSPHLIEFRERMRIDGEAAPYDWIAENVGRYKGAIERLGVSFFEASTALSFRFFADSGAIISIVEVGLGGRLDATNVLPADCSIITSIGLDHIAILGDTVESIATEKSGIMRPGKPVFSGVQNRSAISTLQARAAQVGAKFISIPADLVNQAALERIVENIVLPGAHQKQNALVALAAAKYLIPTFRDKHGLRGVRDVAQLAGLRGRMEEIASRPTLFADVAHNPEAVAAAVSSVISIAGRLDRVLVGFMKDKDGEGIASVLSGSGATAVALSLPGERALPAEEVANLLRGAGIQVDGIGWTPLRHVNISLKWASQPMFASLWDRTLPLETPFGGRVKHFANKCLYGYRGQMNPRGDDKKDWSN